MAKQTYHKSQIATAQLRTAVALFLGGGYLCSAITLAGAASVILEMLVRNSGKTAFIDYACRIAGSVAGTTPPRSQYRRRMNDLLGINQLKHMTDDCDPTLDIDLEKSAEHAIGKAVADYVILYGQEHDFVKAYLQWAWINRDGPAIMKDYQKLPTSLKRK
jgi:hypothetical protein